MSLTDRVTRRVDIAIRLDALNANFAALKQRCSPSKFFAVVKSDAYGHGAVTCASALSDADGFAVVHPNEAQQLRDAGISQPILVLQGAASLSETRQLAMLNCMPVVHQLEQCEWIEQVGLSTPITVWIKTETGMGRLGLTADDAQLAAEKIQALSGVSLGGIMSHLASADETQNSLTRKQLETLCRQTSRFPGVPVSLANSAATLAWPETRLDWVRPGIALYGSNPLDVASPVPLSAVMQVTAPLIALRQMRQGDGVGYGSDYQCPEDMTVGVAAIGYGDGLPRVLVNGSVELDGQMLPIIGRVSMDSIVLDLRPVLTRGYDIKVGDRVTVWGENHPAERLAAAANTITYELFCGIRGTRRAN